MEEDDRIQLLHAVRVTVCRVVAVFWGGLYEFSTRERNGGATASSCCPPGNTLHLAEVLIFQRQQWASLQTEVSSSCHITMPHSSDAFPNWLLKAKQAYLTQGFHTQLEGLPGQGGTAPAKGGYSAAPSSAPPTHLCTSACPSNLHTCAHRPSQHPADPCMSNPLSIQHTCTR